ncbi:PHP domain-containing protein [Aerococcus agrisoli]|uniref:PHP domain-containing protein n=1 Tax=Aerococcus agrisoli TaxID=2487350 RepID=UPI0013159CC0|nr:PHP-associated domain-containing protein [Aerococcus agrisoli]
MRIDTHTHGKLAKNLPFSEQYTQNLFKEAKKRGVEALALTEHFNTQEFDKIYQYIHDKYERQGDTFLVEGVRVFPGLEIDILEGGHNLVIGNYEEVQALRQEILSISTVSDFLPAAKLFPLVKKYDVIFGAAHVYRKGCNNLNLDDSLIDMYDFFDLNGKDTGLMGPTNVDKIKQVAAQYGKPVLAGSDTHQYLQYGSVINDFKREFDTIADFRKEIASGDYELLVHPAIQEKIEGANLLKKALKELQKAGGSYDVQLVIE